MKMRILFGLLITIFLLHSAPVHAHRPYFRAYSDWIKFSSGDYQIQGWYGDGIFFADPVSVTLRHRNGGMVAWTEYGRQASGYCPSVDNCWGFTFPGVLAIFPAIWRLDPIAAAQPPQAITGHERDVFNYPEDAANNAQGFILSDNLFMIPVAWLTLLLDSPDPFAIWGFNLSLIFIVLRFFQKKVTKGILRYGLLLSVAVCFLLMLFVAVLYAEGIHIAAPLVASAMARLTINLFKRRNEMQAKISE